MFYTQKLWLNNILDSGLYFFLSFYLYRGFHNDFIFSLNENFSSLILLCTSINSQRRSEITFESLVLLLLSTANKCWITVSGWWDESMVNGCYNTGHWIGQLWTLDAARRVWPSFWGRKPDMIFGVTPCLSWPWPHIK